MGRPPGCNGLRGDGRGLAHPEALSRGKYQLVFDPLGGSSSTGRERMLDLRPEDLPQRVPVTLGWKQEVERLVGYHETDAAQSAT